MLCLIRYREGKIADDNFEHLLHESQIFLHPQTHVTTKISSDNILYRGLYLDLLTRDHELGH